MSLFVIGLPVVFRAMSRVVPENYNYLAQEAISLKQFKKAEAILNGRITREWYDFSAHYLLAEAQSSSGRHGDAAETMRSILSKSIAIWGRIKADQAGYSGFDEAKTIQLLGQYLWLSGQPLNAAETWRHAMDLGSSVAYDNVRELPPPGDQSTLGQAAAQGLLALRTRDVAAHGLAVSRLGELGPMGKDLAAYLRSRWQAEQDNLTTASQAPLKTALIESPGRIVPLLALRHILARHTALDDETSTVVSQSLGQAAARQASLKQFAMTPGSQADGTDIRMVRNSTVTGKTDTGMFQADYMVIAATATEAFGQWPVLIVRVQGKEAARLYLDGSQPGLRVIGPFEGGLPKVMDLELQFINDAFDPVTRADRDIRIHGIWFQ